MTLQLARDLAVYAAVADREGEETPMLMSDQAARVANACKRKAPEKACKPGPVS